MLHVRKFEYLEQIYLLVIGVICCISSISFAQENPWSQKTDMITARMLHSTSVVEAKIYVIGGATSEPNSLTVLPVEVYDPVIDSWTQKADIITGRALLSTSVINGKIYAIGGCTSNLVGLSTVEMYDPATDTWTALADMPTPRAALSTSVVDGKIYAIGGTRTISNLVGLALVEMYDPATDTWTKKTDMPTSRLGLCTAVVDGQIYALGGSTQNPAVHKVEAYDPLTDIWTPKADMPTARRNFAASMVDGKIYAIGGWLRSSYYAFQTVEQYDPITDIWITKTGLPKVRSCLSTSTVDGKIYAIGGTDKTHPCPALSTVYEYDAELDSASVSIIEMNTGNDPKSFMLFQNYPNPFNPTTTIRYYLTYKTQVHLSVINLLGHIEQVLVDELQSAGEYQVLFNGANMSSGIYFYRMQTQSQNGTASFNIKKFVLTK